MPIKRTYDYILLFLLATLAITSYINTRYALPPVINQSVPLLTPLLKPTASIDWSFLQNSSNNQPQNNSDGGSQLIIIPTNQTSVAFIKVNAYDKNPSSGQNRAMGPINWSTDGPILPGQSVNSPVIYFQNEGNVPVSMSLSTVNWSMQDYTGKPLDNSYQRYFSLTWDFDDSVLPISQTKPVIITLTVSPDIVDVVTFSFNLAITVSPH